MLEIDSDRLAREIEKGTPGVLLSNNRLPESSTAVDGIASPTLMATAALSLILGITVDTARTLRPGTELLEAANVTIPAAAFIPGATATTDQTLIELRKRIEQTGIPLFDDDELRQEIRDRRGLRS